MDEREILQKDILKELIQYSDSLIPALQKVIEELKDKEKEQEDTDDFLSEVINGINWEIEVYNQCATLINERCNYIDKKVMIASVKSLGMALNSGDLWLISDCLEYDFLPFLNKLDLAAKLVVGQE
ncbi:MAG: hypothetical protein ACI4F4_01380 [Lachnospiraceae bacterium]